MRNTDWDYHMNKRRALVTKMFDSGLTREEKIQKAWHEYRLNEIEMAETAENFIRLQQIIDNLKAMADRIDAEISSLRGNK